MDKLNTESGISFTLRRINAVAHSVRWLGARAFLYHRINMEGVEHLPRTGTALILPKHRAYRDIVLEGGGIKIGRPKDVRKIKDRDKRRLLIREAREKNRKTLEYLAWLYRNDELVISHPEGMRFQDDMGNLQKEIVEHALHVEQSFGLRIPLIPIGLEYESFSRPFSRIDFRIGSPMYSGQYADLPELMDAIDERIRTLSGFEHE